MIDDDEDNEEEDDDDMIAPAGAPALKPQIPGMDPGSEECSATHTAKLEIKNIAKRNFLSHETCEKIIIMRQYLL